MEMQIESYETQQNEAMATFKEIVVIVIVIVIIVGSR